ncbi:MAG TPA: DivIVA domain-containing protein [Acidimicrobiales bacterium]|nr:DivIVA domain-containing protein [Acidimicrobiales bacterium]
MEELSPRTLREVEFREKLRGYHPDDVDEFLDRVAAGVEQLQERLKDANERLARAESRVGSNDETDDTLRKTLVLAQRTADLAISEAKEEAAAIVFAARADAEAALAAAQEQVRALEEDSLTQIREEISGLEASRDQLGGQLDALGRWLEEERSRLRVALEQAVAHVDELIPVVQPAPSYSSPSQAG